MNFLLMLSALEIQPLGPAVVVLPPAEISEVMTADVRFDDFVMHRDDSGLKLYLRQNGVVRVLRFE